MENFLRKNTRIKPRYFQTPAGKIPALLMALTLVFISACSNDGGGDDSGGTPALIEKSGYYSTLTIPQTGLEAHEGKKITLTKNGVEIRLTPGETYNDVYVTLTDDIPVNNMGNNYTLRTAAYINNRLVPEKSASRAVISGEAGDRSADNIVIDSQNDNFNGIIVDGNTVYTITDPLIKLNGHGGDDFAGYGAGIMATGNSNVVVENARIDTKGAIRTAIWAGGQALLLVKNSKIWASDGDSVDFPVSMMNEVPWILGLKGNLRATNVLGAAKATYLNSTVSAQNWGALSTDSNQDGASLTAINTDIVIYGESGYGSYADAAVQNYYYGSRFNVPERGYGLIVAAGSCGAVFAKSTQANVGADLYSQIPAEHRDEPTVVKSGGFGVMWHQNRTGTVTVKEETEFDCGKTVFLIKSGVNIATPTIVVDNAVLKTGTGVILHLMESDDPGMGGGPPGSDTMWATEYVVPTVNPQVDDNNTTVEDENTVKAAFSNMTVTGNIYNSRWTVGQDLSVTFDDADVTGLISTGTQSHNGLSSGDKITKATYYKISGVSVTPSPVVNSGLLVTLKNESTWTVTGTSHLSKLDYGTGCTITPSAGKTLTAKVDDNVTTLTAGNTYTGKIEITVN
ncbi:MAG: hypothetical protein LBF63_04350 [Treponema sp.]|jgi:hypothetical protein|nr:hypothetical protein [Treponema sp.]